MVTHLGTNLFKWMYVAKMCWKPKQCSNCHKLMINHRLCYKVALYIIQVMQCSFIAIDL